MKNLLLIAIAILGFSAVSFGQTLTNSATATAGAEIIAPLTIENKGDMNFGKVYASTTSRDLKLSTDGTRSGTAGYNSASTASAAHFEVVGTTTTAYSIALSPATVSTDGADPMTVDTWVCDPTVAVGGNTGATGKQTINVGATLHLNANQAPGLYVTTPFTVTVNYN